ncbi:hypothetical protein MBLNU459_g8020t1 [Dothideomycetes sp. NU459]
MALNNTTSLAVAELVIYIVILPVITYVLLKHGKKGIQAWFYLITFAILRIVPAAMQISEYNKSEPESETAAIIDSIGLSPLLLASSGVLGEILYYLHDGKGLKTKLGGQCLIHAGTIAGVALAAYGGSQLVKSGLTFEQVSKYEHMQEAGCVLMFLVWIILLFSAARLVREVRSSASPSMFKLFIAVAVALLPIGIRSVYGIVYAFDHSPDVSSIYGTFAIRLLLVFLMQLLAALAMIAGGVISRNIVKEHKNGHYAFQKEQSSEAAGPHGFGPTQIF